MIKKTGVYLAVIAAKDGTADKSLTDLIERECKNIKDECGNSKKLKLKIARSCKVFSAENGLALLLLKNENIGTVFAVQDDFDIKWFEAAVKTGIRFAIVYKNESGEWEGFYMEPDGKKSPFMKRAEEAIAVEA